MAWESGATDLVRSLDITLLVFFSLGAVLKIQFKTEKLENSGVTIIRIRRGGRTFKNTLSASKNKNKKTFDGLMKD